PAMTSRAPASANTATSAQPSPRPAPLTNTRLPSISMYVYFFRHRLIPPLRSRELVKDEPDEPPNQNQLDARQRFSVDPLSQRLRSQHLDVLADLNNDHQPHREHRDDRRHLLHPARQVDI